MHIKNCISKDDEKFNETFSKLWGSSRGWVSLVCSHSVVYGLKFLLHAESPCDYVDLLLSMKYLPNVVISDMANLIAKYGNDRSPGMFSPNDGMMTEPTKDNITRAENDDLVVHFPWLRDECPIEENNNSVGHPVSGSSVHLCLFDRFHERNVKGKRDILRRITFIPELKGLLNSECDEQLHYVYNKDTRFLNQMQPLNHLFMFRSNLDIRNIRIN